MNYKKLTEYVQRHNDLICHITTWQTWKKLDAQALTIIFELIDNDLLTDYSNEELYKVYLHICCYRYDYWKALKSNDLCNVIDLLEQV